MRISNKQTYLYPVLREESSDYLPNCTFDLLIEPLFDSNFKNGSIILNCRVKINSKSLLDCLKEEDAIAYLDLRSPDTLFQKIEYLNFMNSEGELLIKIDLPFASIFGDLSCTAVICVGKTKIFFQPTDIHEEFGEYGFDIDYGSPLAISNTVVIPVDFEDRAANAFIHVVTSKEMHPTTYEIKTQEDQIVLYMGAKARTAFDISKNNPELRPFMFLSVYKDCLAVAIENMSKSVGSNLRWMESLQKNIEAIGENYSSDSSMNDFNRIALKLVENQGVKKVVQDDNN